VPYEDTATTPGQIVEAAAAHGLDAAPAGGVEAALDHIVQTQGNGPGPRVLICGSLYLAGSVLATDPQEDIGFD